jgi:hypothetical protein
MLPWVIAHRDLFTAMASAAMGASLGILNGICQVLLATWQVLGSCSMLQLEAILQAVLLKLADGKPPSPALVCTAINVSQCILFVYGNYAAYHAAAEDYSASRAAKASSW